jgi:hypothetical protein
MAARVQNLPLQVWEQGGGPWSAQGSLELVRRSSLKIPTEIINNSSIHAGF